MNEYFVWDAAKFSLHVPEMDEEHKTLIALMNELHCLHQQRHPMSDQRHALEKLMRYTAKHFADEEAYMDRIAFPGARIHKGVHKQLLEKLQSYHAACASAGELPEDLFVFFKMWLSAHICGIDAKYAQHARMASSA